MNNKKDFLIKLNEYDKRIGIGLIKKFENLNENYLIKQVFIILNFIFKIKFFNYIYFYYQIKKARIYVKK